MSLKIRHALVALSALLCLQISVIYPASSHAAPGDAGGRKDPASAARWQRLERLASVIRQAARAPGPVGESVREALRERDEVLFNQEAALPQDGANDVHD